jgi:SAM-dependent methyltransferase
VEAVTLKSRLLEHTLVYRLWQAPFVEQKFAPILAHNDLTGARRVLDVACGPGTNTHHFVHSDYLGVDINERYIRTARHRHRRSFVVADVRSYRPASGNRFDFVLVNSFLHHLNREDVLGILTHLRSLLTEDGNVHLLELVLPEDPCISRWLARADRGEFVRSLQEWKEIFGRLFEPMLFEPYRITCMGIALWDMVYFKGRCQR